MFLITVLHHQHRDYHSFTPTTIAIITDSRTMSPALVYMVDPQLMWSSGCMHIMKSWLESEEVLPRAHGQALRGESPHAVILLQQSPITTTRHNYATVVCHDDFVRGKTVAFPPKIRLFENRIVASGRRNPAWAMIATYRCEGTKTMKQLAYTRGDSTYAFAIVDESGYADALALLANCIVGQVNGEGKDTIAPASVEYSLHYGLKQTLQDAAAQPAASAREEGTDVNAAISDAMAKRFKSLCAGTVAMRVGTGTRDPFESMVRRVVNETLAKAAKSQGKKLPKDKAKLEKLRATVYAAKKDEIDAEAKSRLEATGEIDVDDIEL